MTPDEMTVEDALEEAGMVAMLTGESESELRFSDLTPKAMAMLAAEVRSLRARIEAVRALEKKWLAESRDPETEAAILGDDELKIAAAFTFRHVLKECRNELLAALGVLDD